MCDWILSRVQTIIEHDRPERQYFRPSRLHSNCPAIINKTRVDNKRDMNGRLSMTGAPRAILDCAPVANFFQ